MSSIITPDLVLRFDAPADGELLASLDILIDRLTPSRIGFLCPLSANTYGIEFLK